LRPEAFEDLLRERVRAVYDEREAAFTPPIMRQLERFVLLQTIDALWKEHLLGMDHLKEGISLRGYGQRNPLQEYQKEGFAMFEEMIGKIQEDAVQKVFAVQIAREEDLARQQERRRQQQERLVMSGGGAAAAVTPKPARRDGTKVGRNDPARAGAARSTRNATERDG